MAIAFDAVNTGNIASSTSLTYSLTTTGSNITVTVFVYSLGGVDSGTVKYNGATMTKAFSQVDAGGILTAMYKLYIGAGAGAQNVDITGLALDRIDSGAISYTGTDPTQNGVSGGNSTGGGPNTSTSVSLTLTTTGSNSWLAAGGRFNGTSGATPTGSTVERWDITPSAEEFGGDLPCTTPGNYSIGWSHAAANDAIVGFEMIALGGATSTTHNLPLLGVGT